MLATFVHPQSIVPPSRFQIQLWELGGANWKNKTVLQAKTYNFVDLAHRRPIEIRTKTISGRDDSAILQLGFLLMPSCFKSVIIYETKSEMSYEQTLGSLGSF